MGGRLDPNSGPDAPREGLRPNNFGRAASWIAAVVAGAVGLVVVLGPLFDAGRPKPPFGRPWFLGTGGLLLLGLAARFWLRARRSGFQAAWETWRRCAIPAGFLLFYLVFVANKATLSSGDNLPNRALPIALLSGQGLDLSRTLPADLRDHYSILELDGRRLSAFPLGTGLLATPYYAAAAFVRGGDMQALFDDRRLEKHLAALLTSASVVFVFLAAGAYFKPSYQALCAALFALATQALPSISQGLWSFTGEHFFLSAALALLAFRRNRASAGFGGLLIGLACFCRPTAILLLPLAWSMTRESRRARLAMVAGLAFLGSATAVLNYNIYGHLLGGYGLLNASGKAWAFTGFLENLAGVLASPSRGALFFFPAAILALFVGDSRADAPGLTSLRRSAGVVVAAVVLVTATYGKWWGGYSLGPRLLAEISIPAAFLITAGFVSTRRPLLRLALGILSIVQVTENVVLQHSPNAQRWNAAVQVDENSAVLWSLRNSQLASVLPGWEYVPAGPYFRTTGTAGGDLKRREQVDLSLVANERYDVRPSPNEAAWRELPLGRLTAAAPSEREAGLFRIIAPGQPNLVRVCKGETSVAIPMPELVTRQIKTLIAWRSSSPPVQGRIVGALVVRFANDRLERRALKEGVDVFDTSRPGSMGTLRRHRLYAGSFLDRDALVLQRFTLSGRNRQPSTIALEGPREAPDGCLFLLGLTVAPPAP